MVECDGMMAAVLTRHQFYTMDDVQSSDARGKLADVVADFERELREIDERFQARIAQILEEIRQRKMEQLRRDIEGMNKSN